VPAVWAALERALESSELVVTAQAVPQGEGKPTWEWQAEPTTQRREGKAFDVEFVISVFPGGRKDKLTFGCLSEEDVLPPQAEIQLQLMADAVQSALMKLNVESPRNMIHEVPADAIRQA
jgi:hypothetical protein